jgi:hypothetical protein
MKNKYTSKYSDRGLTAAQYITEKICENKAGGSDLPFQFWQLPEWKRFFAFQVVAANALLKIYAPEAILRALKAPDAKWIKSLKVQALDAIIKREQKQLDAELQREERAAKNVNIPRIDVTRKPVERIKKDNIFTKLAELDG